MNYICNLKKSKKDKRDFIYIGSNINPPKILDYRSELTSVRDQGDQGTCFAQTAACVKEWQERKNNNFIGYFSPQFFYNNRFNKYDNDISNDEGMYGRDVMKILKRIGICREELYPYGKIEHKSNIPIEIYKDAELNKIKSYARIFTINGLKKSLFENGPCLIAFPVYNYDKEFWIGNGEPSLGGHAVTVVGYNNEGFIIRNSWGESWGDKGYTTYRYKDWNSHWELWTVIDENIKYKLEDDDIDEIGEKNSKRNCDRESEESNFDINENNDGDLTENSEDSEINDNQENQAFYKKILKALCPLL